MRALLPLLAAWILAALCGAAGPAPDAHAAAGAARTPIASAQHGRALAVAWHEERAEDAGEWSELPSGGADDGGVEDLVPAPRVAASGVAAVLERGTLPAALDYLRVNGSANAHGARA